MGVAVRCVCIAPIYIGEVMFDRNFPEQPPDVIFSPKDNSTGFSPNLEQLPVSTCGPGTCDVSNPMYPILWYS